MRGWKYARFLSPTRVLCGFLHGAQHSARFGFEKALHFRRRPEGSATLVPSRGNTLFPFFLWDRALHNVVVLASDPNSAWLIYNILRSAGSDCSLSPDYLANKAQLKLLWSEFNLQKKPGEKIAFRHAHLACQSTPFVLIGGCCCGANTAQCGCHRLREETRVCHFKYPAVEF